MVKANNDLRQLVKEKGVYMYQVAKDWGIAYNTLCLRLREEWSEKEIVRFKETVEKISLLNKQSESV